MRYHEVESVRQSRLLPRLFRRRGASFGRSSRHRKATGPISHSVLDRNQLGFLAAQWAWRTWECAVAVVLIECPATGQFIATGVETDSDSFQLLSDIQPPVKCPLCGKRHSWTKRDATSVNPDRWSEDPDAEKCLIKAVKNAEQAAAVKSPEDREFHLRMERKWLGLAAGYQLIANVNRRHRSAVA